MNPLSLLIPALMMTDPLFVPDTTYHTNEPKLTITQSRIDEVNRKCRASYTMVEMDDYEKSYILCYRYLAACWREYRYENKTNPSMETLARMWYAGSGWATNSASKVYWSYVEQNLKRTEEQSRGSVLANPNAKIKTYSHFQGGWKTYPMPTSSPR